MNEKEILSHCTIIENINSHTGIWYEELIGEQLVAFGFNEEEDEIYVCYKETDSTTLNPVKFEDMKIVQGSLDALYEMN